ncbi:MAG: hypothetical protein LC647_18035, partial [Beggiatoa sp.]|nr:hypothetical protein [Beggiatoa sp.]
VRHRYKHQGGNMGTTIHYTWPDGRPCQELLAGAQVAHLSSWGAPWLHDLRCVLWGSRRDLVIAAIVVFCISLGLYLDGEASPLGRDPFGQYFLGACAWAFLVALLSREPTPIRVQVAIAMLAATACEYTFAPLYHIYTYRFDNVPAYVPPGHGMVYLTAVVLARSLVFECYGASITRVALLIGTVWSLWGVVFAERLDTGGAALFCVFCAFVLLGRSPLVYVGAFFVTSYLELVGTYWGTWAWALHWPSWGGLPQANPPSGIAAGYCFLDMLALFFAPYVMRSVEWLRGFAAGPAMHPVPVTQEADPHRPTGPHRPL